MGMVINPLNPKISSEIFFLSDYNVPENIMLGFCVEMGNLEIIYKIKRKYGSKI